ncbi:hypothetical protein [Pyruvatibacter sp.]
MGICAVLSLAGPSGGVVAFAFAFVSAAEPTTNAQARVMPKDFV